MHKVELKLQRNLSARPGSARDIKPINRSKVMIPGLVVPAKDINDLMLESKQKDVNIYIA